MEKINEVVKKYVGKKDVSTAKYTLAGLAYMGDFESHESFKASLEYVKSEMGDVFDPDDGVELPVDKNMESYKAIAKHLTDNFSEKKVQALLEIGDVIFAKNTAETSAKKESPREEKTLSAVLKEHPIAVIVAGAVVIGAIILLVVKIK